MKRLFIACLVLTSTSLFAQKIGTEKVPNQVKVAFAKAYPEIKSASWEQEDGNYEVAFVKEGKKLSLLLSASGKIIETEVAVEKTALPKAAKEYIANHYKGARIKETAQITKANGEVVFEAEIKGNDVLFDSTGNYLKEVKN